MPVRCQRVIVRNAELVALQSGGNVGVRLRVDVGLMRRLIGARRPVESATSFSTSSSASLSTLKQLMLADKPCRISSRVLPTPEKTILAGSVPTASARARSPPDTRSNPHPASANTRRTPATSSPSSHSRRVHCGRQSRAGTRPAHRASIASNRRTAACRVRAPVCRARLLRPSDGHRHARCGDGRAADEGSLGGLRGGGCARRSRRRAGGARGGGCGACRSAGARDQQIGQGGALCSSGFVRHVEAAALAAARDADPKRQEASALTRIWETFNMVKL